VLASSPVHVEYELTEKGQALAAVLVAIGQWAEKWVEVEEPPAHARHAAHS
jgi:DNA-binding HxlR family transcriptional regulator